MAERQKTKFTSAKHLIDETVKYYLASRDFNGLPLHTFLGAQINSVAAVKKFLKPLIEAERITVRCNAVDTNPFIKRMPDLSPDREIVRLSKWTGGILVAYPTKKEMAKRLQREDFEGRPFHLQLALGAAWLEFRTFDLSVLEQYRNDPRYYYQASDTHGSISVRDEHYLGQNMKESDKVLLEHFGFAYDDSMNRGVAAFLTDLRKLSPEHQRIWEARRLSGKYKLHPIFWKTQVEGIWVTESVVTDAILWEMNRINEYCEKMGRPTLFRQSFWQSDKPRNFCFLIRPTAKEFAEFCQTLDKMMSENINRDFFQGDIPQDKEIKRGDGKIEVVKKGTVTLLEEWLSKNWKPAHKEDFLEALSIFKEIRKLRNPQAHTFVNDTFDQKYLAEQRTLLQKTHKVVYLLRNIFALHPKVKSKFEDDHLGEGEVYVY
jgi:hypothetical protein